METIKKINYIIAGFRKKILLIFFLILFGSFLELLSLGSLVPLVSFFINDRSFDIEFLKKYEGDNFIIYIIFFIFFIFLFKAIYFSFLNIYKNSFLSKIASNLSKKIFKNYLEEDFIYFNKKTSSKLITNIEETIGIVNGQLNCLINFFIDLSMLLAILIFLIAIEYKLTLTIILALTISSLIYFYLIKYRIQKFGEEKYFLRSMKLRTMQEGFAGFKEIKIFNLENFISNIFYNYNNRLLKINAKEFSLQALPKVFLEFIIILLFILTISFLIYLNKSNSDIAFLLGIFIMASIKTIPLISRSIASFQIFKFGKKALDEIYLEFKYFNKKQEKSVDKKLLLDKKNNLVFKKSIKFNDVTFNYNNHDKVISYKNFEIFKGEYIAIKGKSGSGKTTILNLITGIIQPTFGKIMIDEQQLNSNNIKLWQKKIGYVSQNVFLKEGTILENIIFDKIENFSKIDEKLVRKAIDTVCLNDFVQSLKDNIDSQIGESGAMLSGGQKQRIGIARALCRSPDVLILDESTNAIDLFTEKEIITRIKKEYPDITLIIVSHREEINDICNKLIEIDKVN